MSDYWQGVVLGSRADPLNVSNEDRLAVGCHGTGEPAAKDVSADDRRSRDSQIQHGTALLPPFAAKRLLPSAERHSAFVAVPKDKSATGRTVTVCCRTCEVISDICSFGRDN